MRSKKLSISWRMIVAIFAAFLLMTGTWAMAAEKTLHNFDKGADGTNPYAGVIFDSAGNLYGTTFAGGQQGLGTVIELTPVTGGHFKEKVLYSFGLGKDGVGPSAGLIFDGAGNLYGTTVQGGDYGLGTVFELTPVSGGHWTEQVLHSFGHGKDGAGPTAGLVFDASGNLYGTTAQGGAYSLGTGFELKPKTGGGWTETVLHNFGHSKDGYDPGAGLIFDSTGNLYGTTFYGGAFGKGTVFELSPKSGGGWTEKVVHSFGSGKDGANPLAELVFDAAGDLYGTTYEGGAYATGTVFELVPKTGGGWTEKGVHNFGSGKDGVQPRARLIFDSAGNLYGTTYLGGSYAKGTAFKLTPKTGGGWTEKVLHNFGNAKDGASPVAGVIFDASGNAYSATLGGGAFGFGTVFEITP